MANTKELMETIEGLRQSLDSVYQERNMIIGLLAHLAQGRYEVGIGKDSNPDLGREWQNIIYIELPYFEKTKQLSWHIHENDLKFFERLGRYNKVWDGHSTEEKYKVIQDILTSK